MNQDKQKGWEEAMKIIADLMCIAAQTAPKTKGEDYLSLKVVSNSELKKLAQEMIEFGKKEGDEKYIRDGKNSMESEAVVLLGVKKHAPAGLHCKACGRDCDEWGEDPSCAFRFVDLGIAVGSAVKIASLLNADSRVMYRIGKIAKDNGFMKEKFVLGIPISATGKNIYFDR
jgi:uncharacterized ferredoxin-like protein